MHRAGVQGLGARSDAQKPGRLFKSPGSQARHLLQGVSGGKGAVAVPVRHDGVGQTGSQAGNVGQQLRAGGVQLHPHLVDATGHHIVQALLQSLLINVVLVLAHTDGLGVDLDQFGQGVHEPTTDGDRPTYGDVLIREFGSRRLRR